MRSCESRGCPERMRFAEADAITLSAGHSRAQWNGSLRIRRCPLVGADSFQALRSRDLGREGKSGLAVVSPPPACGGFAPCGCSRIGGKGGATACFHLLLVPADGERLAAALPGPNSWVCAFLCSPVRRRSCAVTRNQTCRGRALSRTYQARRKGSFCAYLSAHAHKAGETTWRVSAAPRRLRCVRAARAACS